MGRLMIRTTSIKASLANMALIFGVVLAVGCSRGTTSNRVQPDNKAAGDGLQTITFGAFTAELPSTWSTLGHDDMATLSEQFQAQSKEIYQRYNHGVADQSRKIDIAAYSTPEGATFVGLVLVVPPGADLMGDLKQEAGQKAKWGIEQGFIKWASEVHPVAQGGFDGFFIEVVNARGTHDFTGGLVHSSRKAEVSSIMLLGTQGGDAIQVFENVLASVRLRNNPSTQR